MYLVYVFRFLMFSLLVQHLVAGEGKCPSSFNCGYLGMIEFPFTTTERQDCGLLGIAGCDSGDGDPKSPKIIKLNGNLQFPVLHVGRSSLLVRDGVLHGLLRSRNCSVLRSNFTLPPNSLLASFYVQFNVTLFRCNRTLNVSPPSNHFQKYSCPDDNIDIYYDKHPPYPHPPDSEKTNSSLSACTMIQLPCKDSPDIADPFTFVTSEIFLYVQVSDDCDKCYHQKGGRCQLDTHNKFLCTCTEDKSSMIIKLKLGLAAFGGLIAVIAGGLTVEVYFLKWKKQSPTNQMIESFLKKHDSLQTKRYNYSDLKKMTNSFQNKLGQGGYGSVYKGQLYDGRLVAVKVLVESKGNGEEFINEVASISRTCHVNIVTLLGFCIQGSKRALIYELMSNGSLEKFLKAENTEMLDYQLNCKNLFDIAIGVARGLEYLHRGCNTRILHFDIKHHNILLDGEFCPKISDFGLAKICPRRESVISLTGARGTLGYIAPEVFSRTFGGVSHKSDVYSYGMLILEMVGGRKNTNVEVTSSSEMYFPHWIYKRLESNQDLELRCIKNESDRERVKKMTVVGLWCIQIGPANRPTMSRVVEMLDGSLESLQMPPKPYIYSPVTSPTHDTHSSLKL